MICFSSYEDCNAAEIVKNKIYRNIINNSNILDSILISTQAVASNGFGNAFSYYINTLSCAQLSKMHFITLCKYEWENTFENLNGNIIPEFLKNIPYYIEYNYNKSLNNQLDNMEKYFNEEYKLNFQGIIKEELIPSHNIYENNNLIDTHYLMLKNCYTCSGSPHGSLNPTWLNNIHNLRIIINYALAKHIIRNKININEYQNINNINNNLINSKSVTIVSNDDISNKNLNTILPLIPDVTIHYRCSDLFRNNAMGFIHTNIIIKAINDELKLNNYTISTIYIIAEHSNRWKSTAIKCNTLYQALTNKLIHTYPQVSVVVKRGDDIVLDMIRLAYSKITICSTSTFCLWFAIANMNVAYFPVSNLVLGGKDTANIHAKWLHDPNLIYGPLASSLSDNDLATKLNE